MRRHALTFSLLLIAAAARAETPAAREAVARARELHLSDRREWKVLLHFERDALFRYRSAIDDPTFFLSPRGRTDPQAELDATVTAFADAAVIEGEPAACRYPARYDWLASQLGFSSAPVCARFEEWRRKMAPAGVSLVFASYYMNNPASMYGHTFLKLTRSGYEASGALLDYTVSYAATTNTNNGILFAARGLLGGYRGRFSTEPYYIKIQKYNNMEARDLWEYKLVLDDRAVDRLVHHLWELGGASMTYFFFNKNCSYQLLPLLEAADPSLHLADRFRFRAIPLDTLRVVLRQPGLIADARLRPSHLRTTLARRALLAPEELPLAEAMAVGPSSAAVTAVHALPAPRRALVLDSAYDLLRQRSGFYRDQPQPVQEREERILSLRREIPPSEASEPALDFGNPPGPQEGHRTGRVGVFAGGDRHRRFQEFDIRASIHDLEDDPTGYVEGSQLEMFNIRLRRQEGAGVYLESGKIFEILSLAPWDRWVHPPSWNVRAKASTAHDLNRRPEDSLLYSLDGGSGLTFALVPNNGMVVYGLWKVDFETGQALVRGYRAGPGATAGTLVKFGRHARLHVSATATRFGAGDISNRVEMRAVQAVDLSKRVQVRVTLARSNAHQEALVGLNLYW